MFRTFARCFLVTVGSIIFGFLNRSTGFPMIFPSQAFILILLSSITTLILVIGLNCDCVRRFFYCCMSMNS